MAAGGTVGQARPRCCRSLCFTRRLVCTWCRLVTARLPGQSDRSAFVDAALEQLLALRGGTAPWPLTSSTREAHLLGLLDEAATLCRARGENLVLVVDGLDKDLGYTAAR